MGLKKKINGQWVDDSGIKDPMTWEGVITLTADSTDTTKCSISVSAPASAADIKSGFIYKVSAIASSPVYTGTLKIGDMFVAAKDAPVVTTAWIENTDWNVIPSGDDFNSLATAVTEVVVADSADPDPPNKLVYYSYANERLTLHKIGYKTDNRFLSTKYPPMVTRETDFINNTSSIIKGAIADVTTYSRINRCNVSDNGTINAFYGDAGYVEDGSNGQVMVKIPKFYYKVTPDSNGGLDGVNIRKCTWEISDTADDGFTLHPAFYDASGNEIDYFLYGAFDAVGQNSSGTYGTSYNTTSDKLSSVAGSSMLPANSLTRATARTMATNRGAGWYNAGVKQTMAVQMLMSVEYGFNSQIGIGQGVVSASAATYAGQTTGNVTSGTQDNKTTPVNWRGIENFWGNIFDWIDGLNINERVPYFCNSYTFVDDTATGYTQISFSLPSSNYITALGYDSNNDWIMLPSETSNATADSAIGDYCYSYSGWRVAQLGGRWTHGSDAGAFYWSCGSQSSGTYTSIGARVMFIPTAA